MQQLFRSHLGHFCQQGLDTSHLLFHILLAIAGQGAHQCPGLDFIHLPVECVHLDQCLPVQTGVVHAQVSAVHGQRHHWPADILQP